MMHGAHAQAAATGSTANQHWWPNQLNLKVLHQNPPQSDPMGEEFDYTEEFCAKYDQAAFDPDYTSAPLEHFEPLIRQFFVPESSTETYNALR